MEGMSASQSEAKQGGSRLCQPGKKCAYGTQSNSATRLHSADDTQLFLSFPFQVQIAPRLADMPVNVKASFKAQPGETCPITSDDTAVVPTQKREIKTWKTKITAGFSPTISGRLVQVNVTSHLDSILANGTLSAMRSLQQIHNAVASLILNCYNTYNTLLTTLVICAAHIHFKTNR